MTTLLDHALIILTFDAVSHSLAPCSCNITDSIYMREEVSKRIVDLWFQSWGDAEEITEQIAQTLTESNRICVEAAQQVR